MDKFIYHRDIGLANEGSTNVWNNYTYIEKLEYLCSLVDEPERNIQICRRAVETMERCDARYCIDNNTRDINNIAFYRYEPRSYFGGSDMCNFGDMQGMSYYRLDNISSLHKCHSAECKELTRNMLNIGTIYTADNYDKIFFKHIDGSDQLGTIYTSALDIFKIVAEYDDFIKNSLLHEAVYDYKFLVFCLGTHKRVGSDSLVKYLVDDVLWLIHLAFVNGNL